MTIHDVWQLFAWFVGAQVAILIGGAAVVTRLARTMLDDHQHRIDARVDERLSSVAEMKKRISEHDIHLARMPTVDDIGRIHGRIDVMVGEFRELKGESAAQSHTLNLIHEHLLHFGGHK